MYLMTSPREDALTHQSISTVTQLVRVSALCQGGYRFDLRPIKGERKVQEVPQSQTAALPRHQEEEETDKSKQAQIDQTYEKH